MKQRIVTALMWFMIILYAPLILCLTGLMLYGGYQLTMLLVESFHQGPVRPIRIVGVLGIDLMILFISFLFIVGLIPLLFREREYYYPGIRLRPNQHPRLFDLIERFCKRLNIDTPDVVSVSPFDNASIGDYWMKDGDGKCDYVRVMEIGAGLVVHSNVNELGTVICHELAHAAAGDTKSSRRIVRFYNSMATMISFYHPQSDFNRRVDHTPGWTYRIIAYMLMGYFYAFSLLYACRQRDCERFADRKAAEICGPKNTQNMLRKIHMVGGIPGLTIRDLFMEYFENEKDVKDIYVEHAERWAKLTPEDVQKAENIVFLMKSSLWDTHPRLADRYAALKDVEAKEWALDQPSTKLFGDWNSISQMITRELVQWGKSMFGAYIDYLDREAQGRDIDWR